MAGVSFVNGNDVGSVIIEGGEPFLLLCFRPILLRGCDVIICVSGALLEGTGRVHRRKRGCPQILRRLFHFRPNVRGDADQMTAQNVLANFVQVFANIRDEFVRRRMFALDLLENFNR